VVGVADGDAAWTAFRHHRPPMVILDWQMPGLDGLEVCRLIREAAEGVDVFVLMITGRDAANDLAATLDAGVDDYLSKPVTADHLAARVRIAERHIAQRAARRRAEEALARAQWLAGIGQTALAVQHEINNPLMTIMSHAQLLEMDPASPPDVRAQAATMLAEGRRIATVVRTLGVLEAPTAVEYLGRSMMLDLSVARA
jgi:DNA-binding response OmpR family regulator